METFTIEQSSFGYEVVATAETGKRKVVATYAREAGAVALLDRLQNRAFLVVRKKGRRPRGTPMLP